jgi:anti-anti-sigma factor
MAIPATAIPLDQPDVLYSLSGGPTTGVEAESGPTPGLATQRFGILAGPAPQVDSDRRIEAWIASNLDLDIPAESAAPANFWNRVIDRLPTLRRPQKKRRVRGGAETAFSEWAHFRIAYRRGITVVRLVDQALAKESQARELACDLIDLVEAGNHRILINFQAVERLATWVVLAVDEAHRRCRITSGGAMKICGLQPQLADIFPIAGMGQGIERHRDETTALESEWPELPGPRALPVEILMALTTSADTLPIRGDTPSEPAAGPRHDDRSHPVNQHANARPADKTEPGLWLIVQMGGAKGRPLSIGSTFLIGRNRDCQLRLGSPMVSKLHAAIERRQGRTYLKDLGSTNGTVLNGRVLRSQEAEIHDGDRIQIGPVVCTLATAAQREGGAKVEEQVAEWLHPAAQSSQLDQIDALETAVIPTTGGGTEAGPEFQVKLEVIQDILVITPQVGELESESAIEFLRAHLHALYEKKKVPRQVVVNLEYVSHVSGQAIGVLLAHHLRLDRSGGGLRICQARARIMAVLHQVRLTMLVECHPTLDEAVLSAWPAPPKGASAGR